MHLLLYTTAFLLVALAAAHSYLGERYILTRVFRRGPLPTLFGSRGFTQRTLRFAWHLTSIAWLGFAALLVALANPPLTKSTAGLLIGTTFLAHAAIAFAGSKGKHFAWPVFLLIGVLAIIATR